jgi:hypothetical protein
MQRIAMSAHLRGEAAEPSGDPPQTDPRATSVSVEARTADGADAAIERISYANHVSFTGESTFTETGTLTLGDEHDEVDVVTVGEGTLGPSAEPGLLHGAVIWRIAAGRGRFAGAGGLLTSNFLLRPATGEVEEWQAGVVFVP